MLTTRFLFSTVATTYPVPVRKGVLNREGIFSVHTGTEFRAPERMIIRLTHPLQGDRRSGNLEYLKPLPRVHGE